MKATKLLVMCKPKKIAHAFVFIILIGFTMGGCKKPATEGTIKVVKLSDGTPVSGAKVIMYVGTKTDNNGFYPCSENKFIKERVVYTGSTGTYTECFKHPALITLEVSWSDGTKTLKGLGSLTIVDHEHKETTVKIN